MLQIRWTHLPWKSGAAAQIAQAEKCLQLGLKYSAEQGMAETSGHLHETCKNDDVLETFDRTFPSLSQLDLSAPNFTQSMSISFVSICQLVDQGSVYPFDYSIPNVFLLDFCVNVFNHLKSCDCCCTKAEPSRGHTEP